MQSPPGDGGCAVGKTLLWVFALTLICGTAVLMAAEPEKSFLADRHAEYGDCISCHEEEEPAEGAWVDVQKCLDCHGAREELGGRTLSFGEYNPHKNHLSDPDCTICHMGHMESRLYCVNCHDSLNPEMR
ncbi:MAG: cytochrome c3 family protein [Deltaproteobacteria bacterium]|jgi:fumarate reductase flavoprotein subunit|nr:cytochrome c3 family protein [Deltaproteobacteria bacterium]